MSIFCKDCEYICKPAGALYEPHPDSICLNQYTGELNYVTGELEPELCKFINSSEGCTYFMNRLVVKEVKEA